MRRLRPSTRPRGIPSRACVDRSGKSPDFALPRHGSPWCSVVRSTDDHPITLPPYHVHQGGRRTPCPGGTGRATPSTGVYSILPIVPCSDMRWNVSCVRFPSARLTTDLDMPAPRLRIRYFAVRKNTDTTPGATDLDFPIMDQVPEPAGIGMVAWRRPRPRALRCCFPECPSHRLTEREFGAVRG